ncbi:MAG: response regulator [Nannocystis sp.]|nr:response regulator [Nannocystis sp.]MBA3547016.1 response regulator [Nannocystis sp.]
MQISAEAKSAAILVVDDNEANRLLARSTLEDEGHRVVLATGGTEAVAAFEREQPDCILLDVCMPDMDGFAACAHIRALPRGKEVPILFLTALRDIETFDGALLAGGDDFLTKPVRPAELVVRVSAALKLRRMSAELREHYALLKDQRDVLVRLQLQKERLMAFVVHDLKNPLNSMALHAQMLLRDGSLSAGVRKSATSIYTAARELDRMILNLLDVSKAEEGKLHPRCSELDLHALVANILTELAVDAERRPVTLRSSVLADRVHADQDLLHRTLANLVENAIRYAPPATMIMVTVVQVATAIELRVADEGSGISEEMREKVFDPFVQVEAGENPLARGGRGLGLAFCKLAVEAHGGRIWVEDAAPGAIFCVRLPAHV